MASCLPINIDDLLHNRGVESARVEFKPAWNEGPTGTQVLHTICAFANDLYNVSGGYVVIGVDEQSGTPILPPRGINPRELDEIQHALRGQCNRIDPVYQPILSPEVVDGRHILVVWAPASDVRPHQAPTSLKSGERAFYVRLGTDTVEAKGQVLTELLSLSAKVPFDDRRAPQFTLNDLRATLVREFLADVRSDLLNEQDDSQVYRCMRITERVNGHEVPKNVALLFFADNPEIAFRGARVEVAHFADDGSGDVIEEQTFRGPLQQQIRDCLRYLGNLSTSHFQKHGDRPETSGWVSFPLPALEESIVNAVYHRSYEPTIPEPVKVYLYPDRMEITSYPGPVPGLRPEHFQPGHRPPNVPLRNRRIGEFLKELGLAEARGTGVPKVFRSMAENGSPPPKFEFDETRSYFTVTLPAHPEYIGLCALRDAASLSATGNRQAAIRRLETAHQALPGLGSVAAQLIEELSRDGNLTAAQAIYDNFRQQPSQSFQARATVALADGYLNAKKESEAQRVLNQLPAITSNRDLLDLAILERRAGRQERAHALFERAGEAVLQDSRALHEFAQTKMKLASALRRSSNRYKQDARRRLLRQAKELLHRVVQLDASPARHGWAWYHLGQVRSWLEEPQSQVRHDFDEAIKLLPNEQRFRQELAKLPPESKM